MTENKAIKISQVQKKKDQKKTLNLSHDLIRNSKLVDLADDAAPEGKPVKTEVILFNKELTATTKGDFLFDDVAAESVMQAYKEDGVQLYFDYDHSFGVAAGWFDLEVRDGSLWAVNIKWTKKALQSLEDREYRYYSPTFYIDEANMRVTKMINAALTNMPATKNQEPIAAAKDKDMADETDKTNELAKAEDLSPLDALKKFLTDGDMEEAMKIVDELIAQAQADADADESDKDEGGEGEGNQPTDTSSVAPTQTSSVDLSNDPKYLEMVQLANQQALELKAFKDSAEKKEKELLVEELLKLGKVAPSSKEWFLSLSKDQLTAFGEKAAPLAITKEFTAATEPSGLAKWNALSDKEKKSWKDFGFDQNNLPKSFTTK